jgi:hypothetical protein
MKKRAVVRDRKRPSRKAFAGTSKGRGANREIIGPIVPTRAAFLHVEAEYPDRPPAEKYRLAQAQTLIDLHLRGVDAGKGVASESPRAR